MINPTTIATYPRSTPPTAQAVSAESKASATMDILPALAIAAAVITAKLSMLALLIHAL